MIIANTTYHVHADAAAAFARWLVNNFLPQAQACRPQVMRVLGAIDTDTEAWAVQTLHANLADAQAWEDGVAAKTRQALTPYVGRTLVYFTTMMEVVDPAQLNADLDP